VLQNSYQLKSYFKIHEINSVGFLLQEKKAIAAEHGGQTREDSGILTFSLSKASPGVYSTYRNAFSSLVLFIYACVDCALHIEFLDDGNRLHASTLSYITLVVHVFIFID
jgi:hypothetical protein